MTTSAPVRWRITSTRTRLLAWYVLLLVLASTVSYVALRTALSSRLDARVEDDLRQEAQEFRALLSGNDPATGQPFGADLEAVVDTFLRRNLPALREAVFTYVEGAPYRSSSAPPADLFAVPGLDGRWRTTTADLRGSAPTSAGEVEYLAVPVDAAGTEGTFVVAVFTRRLQQEVDASLQIALVVDLVVLALATAAAYVASGRVLAPLRRVTETARRIEEDDLAQRLEVRGEDELAELGRTFNAMLDRLERAMDAQRQFAADAGHELRTPITIVRGHLELMGDSPQDRRETVDLVTDELDRMARLVDDLLLLARAQRPDALHLEDVDAAALVRDAAARAVGLGDRAWRTDEVAVATLRADRQRLGQALLQLAGNAVRHTAPGQVVALGSACDGGRLRLWVRDEGEGIAPEDQTAVFARFARGRGARGEGSGLGLAIVRAVVEGHGGQVELVSAPGEGSTFTLVLPLADEALQGAALPGAAPSGVPR